MYPCHSFSTSLDKFRLLLPYKSFNIKRLKLSSGNLYPKTSCVFKDKDVPFISNSNALRAWIPLYDHNIWEIEDLIRLSQVSEFPLNFKIGQINQVSSHRIEREIYPCWGWELLWFQFELESILRKFLNEIDSRMFNFHLLLWLNWYK